MLGLLRRAWRDVRRSRIVLGSGYDDYYRRHLGELFAAANGLLRGGGVDYWLVFGTLLGHHREGGLIPGDQDIDFGAPEREHGRIWELRRALPAGYQMKDTSRFHDGPKLFISSGDGWKADIS